MSKRQSKTGVQHLVYQAKTGFQYYFTFPGYIGNHPQLPAQIRWSLGHDEALARDLAQYLNPRFEDLLRRCSADTIELDPEGFLLNLAIVHAEISRFTESHLKIWRSALHLPYWLTLI